MAVTRDNVSDDAHPSVPSDHNDNPNNRDNRDNRDATELDEIHIHNDNQTSSSVSVSSDEDRITARRTRSQSQSQASQRSNVDGPFSAIRKFWTRSIVLTVPQKSSRDHLGKSFGFWSFQLVYLSAMEQCASKKGFVSNCNFESLSGFLHRQMHIQRRLCGINTLEFKVVDIEPLEISTVIA